MARVLNAFASDLEATTTAARALPFLSGVLFKGMQFTQQAPQLFNHRLGHPYVGYWVTRAQNVSSLIASGTRPPPVTITGTLTPGTNMAYQFALDIVAGGALGTATFKYTLNGGTSYSSTASTAASVLLGNTGLTANFPAGTYSTNNVYTSVLPPGSGAPVLFEQPMPAGASPSQSVYLQCATNALLDFVVF